MEKNTQIKIEIAKSWFNLSQIFIILAGFMYASAGITYQAVSNTNGNLNQMAYSIYNEAFNSNLEISKIQDSKLQIFYQNYSQGLINSMLSIYTEEQKFGKKILSIYLYNWIIACIFTAISIFLYFKGKRELSKLII